MKVVAKFLSLACFILSLTSLPAQASIEQALANICDVIKTNDKSGLRKKMKTAQSDYGLKLADYYGGITCGGSSMIRYAIINGAADTGALLVKKLSKKVLRAPEGDGMTALAWAQANHPGSPTTAVINDRVN
jgi:hypothetical protein